MKRLLICLALLNCVWLHVNAQWTIPTGSTVGNQKVIEVPITSYNTMAQALLYLPDDYFLPVNANKRYPIFIFLHGTGEGASNDINEVCRNSLPKLIKNGLKPYGIDPVTRDTIKWITVCP